MSATASSARRDAPLFEQFTDTIIVRENKGLDVWAYKTALDFYGWEKLSEYDEIVMTNSTLMGPVRPLREMFEAMWENQDLDFWGLSVHHGAKSNPFKGKHLYNYLPVHIQSHFIVYRKRFVQNPELQAYWDTMPMIESYTDSVQRYEAVFTKQFGDKGFKWDVYVKTDDLKEFTDYPLLVCPTLLLREKKCPLFKRRSFMHTLEAYLNDTAGEPVQELYDYLRDETDYPLELIWKNMIRTMHPHDFTRNLALTRIIEPTVQDAAAAQSFAKTAALRWPCIFILWICSARAGPLPPNSRHRPMSLSQRAVPIKSRRSRRPLPVCRYTALP